jgi:hypothetical protein
MGDFGIKISAKGEDVETAKDLSLSSTRNCFKVKNAEKTTITTDVVGIGSVTINHGLLFRPVAIVAINFNGAYYFEPYSETIFTGLLFYAQTTFRTIEVNMVSLGNGNKTFDIYYWVSESEDLL